MSRESGAIPWRILVASGFALDMLGMLLLGADLVYGGPFLAGAGWAGMATGVAIMLIGLGRRTGGPATGDERIARIRGHSAYWTLVILVAAMGVLGVLQLFAGIEPGGMAVLAILTMLAAIAFIGLNVYYDRRGDVG